MIITTPKSVVIGSVIKDVTTKRAVGVPPFTRALGQLHTQLSTIFVLTSHLQIQVTEDMAKNTQKTNKSYKSTRQSNSKFVLQR